MPEVSVVVPFLDPPPEFFAQAIDSVLAQTLTDWELVLVDDGSGAAARDVAERFAATEPGRILVRDAPEPRPSRESAARNLGVEHAAADLIAFLDADDVYEPDRLLRHATLLAGEPDAALVVGDTTYWSSWSAGASGSPHAAVPASPDAAVPEPPADFVPAITVSPGPVAPPELAVRIVAEDTAVPCVCSITVRRSAFEAVAGFEASWPSLYADQVLLIKLLAGYRAMYLAEPLERYRMHPGSVTRRATAEAATSARRRFLAWIEEYTRENAPPEARVSLDRARRTAEWRLRHPAAAAVGRRFRKRFDRQGPN